ncbi:MAG: methionyl-tRNA formyltransferase, partial [Alistipes sp.]|nr:methionyl-tRNA formyltransferase [Alistipes sp.]
AMQELKPDLGIVIAFRMLPEVIWAMPRLGTFNLHASLLPQYRGAAPINWAIINGEKETGITTFLLNHEIDKGAIIAQHTEPILAEDNIGTMYDKLMTKGCDLVVDTVEKIASGDFTAIEQMHIDEATLKPAPKIFKDDCRIDWSWEGERIVNFVRGLSPYPAAWSPMFVEGEERGSAKIFEVKFEPKQHSFEAGKIFSNGKESISVSCADGIIHIRSMQLAGKKRMSNHDLLLGFRDIDSYTFR